MLAHVGWECDAVADGRSATVRALTGDYDAVLLDLLMPGTDGFQAARSIREQGSRVTLLAVSGADERRKPWSAASTDASRSRTPWTICGP
jgi:DNA-binding response OmpR family regulator